MLNQIFLQLLHMSYTASYVMVFILLARIALQKAPKIFSYALWSAALFRLICPWSFESALSLLSIRRSTAESLGTFSGQPMMLETIDSSTIASEKIEASTNALNGVSEPQIWNILVYLWLVGIAALVIFNVVALFRLKKQLSDSVCNTENIYVSKRLTTPFVMGVIRPKIYLPEFLSEAEKLYILPHEQTHIRRLDHIIKIVSFLVLCMHWFNPLVWLAFFLSDRDREMSCDEAVIKKLGRDVKKEYSSSLLSLATDRRIANSTPLAFSEGGAKSRIKNILHYKRPKLWVTAASLMVIIAICAGLICNPVSAKESTDGKGLKPVFWLEKKGGSYEIVEKTNKDALSPYFGSMTSYQPEDVLTERMGFQVHFPNLLDGEYVCLYKSEGIVSRKNVSLADKEEMMPNVQKAIDDETAFKNLKVYGVYRDIAGFYGHPPDAKGRAKASFAISMRGNDSVLNYDPVAETKTKVGDISAKWLEIVSIKYAIKEDGRYDFYSKPQGIENSFVLTWDANGIRYHLSALDGEMQLTMEDAVKIAESFMAGQ